MKKQHPLAPLIRLLIFIFLVTNVFCWHQPALASMRKEPAPSLSGPPLRGSDVFNSSAGVKIEKIYLSPATNTETTQPSIYLLKDVHLNPEAQRNMARWIEGLLKTQAIDLIGVEGTYGVFDFSRYRSLPDLTIKKGVADSYFMEGKIGAPSYVGLTTRSAIPMVGIEDPGLYESNVRAYLQASGQMEALTSFIQTRRKELAFKRARILTNALQAFEQWKADYHRGKRRMGEYIRYVNRLSAGRDFYPQIEQFLASLEIEERLDLTRVEDDSRRLMEKLASAMPSNLTAGLMDLGVQARRGAVTFADYYRTLRQVAEQGRFNLGRFPNLNQYIRYIVLADGIRAAPLLKELRELEEQVTEELIQNVPDEKKERVKELLKDTRQLELTEKLSKFELTPAEWEEYKAARGAAFATEEELPGEEPPGGVSPQFTASFRRPFESFYLLAHKRSEVLLKNFLSQPSKKKRLLVSGGFHIQEMTARLEKQGIPFTVVSPKITTVDAHHGSAYLSVFAREKSPLEKLFSGEKLSLNPAITTVGSPHPDAVARYKAMLFSAARRMSAKGFRQFPGRRLLSRKNDPLNARHSAGWRKTINASMNQMDRVIEGHEEAFVRLVGAFANRLDSFEMNILLAMNKIYAGGPGKDPWDHGELLKRQTKGIIDDFLNGRGVRLEPDARQKLLSSGLYEAYLNVAELHRLSQKSRWDESVFAELQANLTSRDLEALRALKAQTWDMELAQYLLLKRRFRLFARYYQMRKRFGNLHHTLESALLETYPRRERIDVGGKLKRFHRKFDGLSALPLREPKRWWDAHGEEASSLGERYARWRLWFDGNNEGETQGPVRELEAIQESLELDGVGGHQGEERKFTRYLREHHQMRHEDDGQRKENLRRLLKSFDQDEVSLSHLLLVLAVNPSFDVEAWRGNVKRGWETLRLARDEVLLAVQLKDADAFAFDELLQGIIKRFGHKEKRLRLASKFVLFAWKHLAERLPIDEYERAVRNGEARARQNLSRSKSFRHLFVSWMALTLFYVIQEASTRAFQNGIIPFVMTDLLPVLLLWSLGFMFSTLFSFRERPPGWGEKIIGESLRKVWYPLVPMALLGSFLLAGWSFPLLVPALFLSSALLLSAQENSQTRKFLRRAPFWWGAVKEGVLLYAVAALYEWGGFILSRGVLPYNLRGVLLEKDYYAWFVHQGSRIRWIIYSMLWIALLLRMGGVAISLSINAVMKRWEHLLSRAHRVSPFRQRLSERTQEDPWEDVFKESLPFEFDLQRPQFAGLIDDIFHPSSRMKIKVTAALFDFFHNRSLEGALRIARAEAVGLTPQHLRFSYLMRERFPNLYRSIVMGLAMRFEGLERRKFEDAENRQAKMVDQVVVRLHEEERFQQDWTAWFEKPRNVFRISEGFVSRFIEQKLNQEEEIRLLGTLMVAMAPGVDLGMLKEERNRILPRLGISPDELWLLVRLYRVNPRLLRLIFDDVQNELGEDQVHERLWTKFEDLIGAGNFAPRFLLAPAYTWTRIALQRVFPRLVPRFDVDMHAYAQQKSGFTEEFPLAWGGVVIGFGMMVVLFAFGIADWIHALEISQLVVLFLVQPLYFGFSHRLLIEAKTGLESRVQHQHRERFAIGVHSQRLRVFPNLMMDALAYLLLIQVEVPTGALIFFLFSHLLVIPWINARIHNAHNKRVFLEGGFYWVVSRPLGVRRLLQILRRSPSEGELAPHADVSGERRVGVDSMRAIRIGVGEGWAGRRSSANTVRSRPWRAKPKPGAFSKHFTLEKWLKSRRQRQQSA